ncbi:MAG TPA: exodeoxyribonuclease V subunit gamma [Solirubrobacteraceae bacterium]|nr:exodeoxyribonuclease V subunit gamma [Solirubrobacteraceae bacterium]
MLHIHRSERADGLVDALGLLLADPLADPFAAEVVAVPTRGMERWLTQRLSTSLGARPGRRDGVCANIDFPFPRRLTADAVATASGIDPALDPWLPERAVWPLLEVIDAALAEPWLQAFAAYLGGPDDPATGEAPDPVRRARRLRGASHITELYDRYAVHRPEMLGAWLAGEHTDGAGRRLPPDAVWQAELWRALRRRIGAPGPAERVAAACERIRADADVVELPRRVSLFGLTRLPAGLLGVLRAIAAARDVHLFLLHPSPTLWSTVAGVGGSSSQTTNAVRTNAVRRDQDTTADLPSNRLLASWGQDAREMQLVLGGPAAADRTDPETVDHHHPIDHATGSLLALIAADVRADRRPAGAPVSGRDDERPVLDPDDRSLQIHSCHGRARQVEVVRDAILHELIENPELESRDVIVMCPDIETFAPLIAATFGAGDVSTDDPDDPLPADGRPADLRVRLADRALLQTNPILSLVSQLMALVGGRVTASEVLDLADREPVRRRFLLDDDDLARIQDWVSASGIRWGLDAAHRAPFKLDALPTGTWRAGLDRVLAGVAMTEAGLRLVDGVLPLDDVGSGSIDLAGRLAELVDRLETALDRLGQTQTIDAWARAIAHAADLLSVPAPAESWQRSELQRLLDDVVEQATVSGVVNPTGLAPAEVRALLADRLRGRPTRANFRTGHLTICTLVPMRSVPHRVVCLLGLDDGMFPRQAPRDGDDLMLEHPHVGERDPRTEDRQMLLDALLAATDRLIITYTGNDERTNTPRPPAVPVGELLDLVDETARAPDGPARDQVLVRHPLQPFDPRNFACGALVRERTWSFDPVTRAGARALGLPRSHPGPFLAHPLPPAPATRLELENLVRFVGHPVRAFLRQRLGISVADYSEELVDAMETELDGLGKWAVGQRLLDALLAGVDPRTASLAEIARGTLPPGALGLPVIKQVFPIAERLAARAQALVAGAPPPASIDVHIALSDGRSLTGTVPGVHGDLLLTATYSRLAAKHRLAAWVRLLALTAGQPDRAFAVASVGRGQMSAPAAIARIAPLAQDAAGRREAAVAGLESLVELYDRGMREPLPLYCLTSAAYAEAVAIDRNPVTAARKAWTSEWNFDHEDKELEHQLVLGGILPFDELPADELGRNAGQLWDDLLAREVVSGR